MYRYEQHCPVARAAELLTEPWTLLVVRELLSGAQLRTEIVRGLPKMSASLLGARLRTLQDQDLVAAAPGAGGDHRYRLTDAGRALGPIVEQLGHWGQRWLAEPPLGDLDPELLVYDICREIDRARLPAQPLIVQVDFADAMRQRHWWLALSADEVVARPGAEGTATVRLTCTLSALAGVWLGRRSWLQAVRDRSIMLGGDTAAVRTLIGCLGRSRYAPAATPAEGSPV